MNTPTLKFLLDANVRFSIGEYLQSRGHDVRWLARTDERAVSDEEVFNIAVDGERILLTNDKDFGKLIHLGRRAHHGVISFRLGEGNTSEFIMALDVVIGRFGEDLNTKVVVITETALRIR